MLENRLSWPFFDRLLVVLLETSLNNLCKISKNLQFMGGFFRLKCVKNAKSEKKRIFRAFFFYF